MNINEMIITALSPVEWLVAPDVKEDKAKKYFTFNYTSIPILFGDDAPGMERYLVQVHLFCPDNFDSVQIRRRAKKLLFAYGFTYPAVFDASDEDGQHWVLECEMAVVADG